MLSPLAPRMMTVSASIPSYMFVWYIGTPLLQVQSDRYGHCCWCDQAEDTARRVYWHKPVQESKPDCICIVGEEVSPRAQVHAVCRARCKNAAGAPISSRRARYSVVQRPCRSRMTSGGGSARGPSQAQVKSAIRGGWLARKYTDCRRTSVRPALAIAGSGLGSSAAWQKQKTPWAASDRAAAWQ